MNLNSNFKNSDEIKNFLHAFNEANWDPKEVTPDKLQQFITRHLEIIANQQDRGMHDELMHLSDRINLQWNNPQANVLAFDIMGIAKGVFNESERSTPYLGNEIWGENLSHIPPRSPYIPQKKGGVPSELEDMHISKELR